MAFYKPQPRTTIDVCFGGYLLGSSASKMVLKALRTLRQGQLVSTEQIVLWGQLHRTNGEHLTGELFLLEGMLASLTSG